MSSEVKISSITVERGIVNKERASETVRITFHLESLVDSKEVSLVHLDVPARGRKTRAIIDEARLRLLKRLQKFEQLLQDLDSFLPPDW